jgi:hypothetical protein
MRSELTVCAARIANIQDAFVRRKRKAVRFVELLADRSDPTGVRCEPVETVSVLLSRSAVSEFGVERTVVRV